MPPRELRLTPTLFHLLLCLADAPKHGYAMMAEIEERTGGALRPGPSSLYYSLGRLEDAGLIAETDAVAATDDAHEERRRYYALLPAGRRRLKEELAMMAQVLKHARSRGIVATAR
ncbi:MAG TPA: PadR family transcriptional regulator [Gemmatimonadaceae bacterium]|nr:PadR family transcriptional regulator [Gemmatimonadaceae bacterium]